MVKCLYGKMCLYGCLTVSFIASVYVLYCSDYGLASMRQVDGLTNDVIHQARQQACKVYLAPEMLVSNSIAPTAPGDVYSYAILLVEIATRLDPYSVSKITF